MKKPLRLLLTTAAILTLLSGCGDNNGSSSQNGREQVTIAFWSDQLIAQYGKYLQETFPDVDFNFYVATNSTDFYRFKMEHDDLPDILTVRRFALNDVADWKDALMDLSDTELTNTFHQSYLRSYTYSDGTVNWLPTCAEADSIVVNRRLLEDNGLSLPTNYEEFVDTCDALTNLGIRPFLSNFSADFTCMELLQGLSASQLTTQEGREWRQQYESGQTNQLDEAVWLPVFERMAEFIAYTGITAEDIATEHVAILQSFQNDELAMMRGTGNEEAIRKSVDGEHLLLPYFGETENWYLTYPAFQIAASASAEESPERKALILDIMTAMLNQNGQEKISSGQNMISYSKNVELELSPELANMQPYIHNNQLYIRLASSAMFSVSKAVVQGMITGEYPDARSAFDAFNAALALADDPAPIAVHIKTGYPYAFDPVSGSQAASAVMNSVREDSGVQLLVGQATCVAGDITAGDYTTPQLQFLTMGESPKLLIFQMTGEQLFQYLSQVLTAPDRRGSVVNDSTLYVSSGFEMTIRKTDAGYALEQLTMDGQTLDQETTYSVAIAGNQLQILQDVQDTTGITEYILSEVSYKQIVADRLAEGRELAEPTDYITLK